MRKSKTKYTELHPEEIRELRETGECFLGPVDQHTTQKGTIRKKLINEARSLGACLDIRYTQTGAGFDNLFLVKCNKR